MSAFDQMSALAGAGAGVAALRDFPGETNLVTLSTLGAIVVGFALSSRNAVKNFAVLTRSEAPYAAFRRPRRVCPDNPSSSLNHAINAGSVFVVLQSGTLRSSASSNVSAAVLATVSPTPVM